MAEDKESRERLATLLNEVAAKEGIHQTLIEGVGVARHTTPLARTSVVYEPMVVFVGQGSSAAISVIKFTNTVHQTISFCQFRCRPSANGMLVRRNRYSSLGSKSTPLPSGK